MTTEELDERLDHVLRAKVNIMTGGYIIKDARALRSAIIDAIKPVISDCIDAVIPLPVANPDEVDKKGQYYVNGFDKCVEIAQKRKRKLLGENL